MATLLAAISGFGAVVVLGFLIRNLIKRPGAIAAAKFPSYMRTSYNTSHVVCLCVIVPWGFAAFKATDFALWKALMLSPICLGFVVMAISGRRMSRQSPEIQEYAADLVKNSWVRRVMDGAKRRSNGGDEM